MDGRVVAGVEGWVGTGVGDAVVVATAVMLLVGSCGAAMLVTREPACEIAHHTAVVDSRTRTTQTPAQARSGSRRIIRTSCRILHDPTVA